MSNIESKVKFVLVAESETMGEIHIISNSNNEFLGAIRIKGDDQEHLEQLTLECAKDHYEAFKRATGNIEESEVDREAI